MVDGCSVSSTVGYISIALSALFFGTYAVPTKTKRILAADVDPFLVAQLLNVAVFVTCWLPAAWEGFFFTYWGLVGAALWTPANALALVAVRCISLSVAQGVWSGVTIIVSFLWGALYFDQPLRSLGGSIGALSLLLIAIFGIALCKPDEDASVKKAQMHEILEDALPPDSTMDDDDDDSDLSPRGTRGAHRMAHSDEATRLKESMATSSALGPNPSAHKPARSVVLNRLIGFGSCVLLGILNGSMMVPANKLSGDEKSLGYLPSFGIGVLIMTIILCLVYFGLVRRSLPSASLLKLSALPSFLAGVFWNIGNAFSLLASISPLGLTIGFPLTQCALLVGGLWGFFYFREMTGWRKVTQFFVSGGVLIGAAYMLSYFGQDTSSMSAC